MSCTSSRPTAFSLRSPLVSSVVLRNMVTACNNSRLLLLLVLDSTKLLLFQICIASLRPIRPQLLDGLRRLLLCPINHHLLISGFSQYLRHHCRRFALCTGNNTLSFFLSLSGYRVSFPLAPSRASQPSLRASVNLCALRASSLSERFRASSRPSRSSSLVKLPVLSAT